MKKIVIWVSAFISLVFFPAFFQPEKKATQFRIAHFPYLNIIKNGDIVLRSGRGFISSAFKKINQKDKRYSHAGIISNESNKLFVYHMIGGEENPSKKMLREPLENFCLPQSAQEFGIYRYDLSNKEIQQENYLVKNYYEKQLIFDTKFDLHSDSAMYCTELVYKIISSAAPGKIPLSVSLAAGIEYIACDDLYMNKSCQLIYSLKY